MSVKVRNIPSKEANNFIAQYHNTHEPRRANLWLGAFLDNGVVGTVGFTSGSFPNFGKLLSKGVFNNREVLLMVRFCVADHMPRNSESIFLSRVVKYIKQSKPDIKMLVTHVDADAGEVGYAWQACNWYYLGLITTRTGKKMHRYILPTGNHRENKEVIDALSYVVKPYPKIQASLSGQQAKWASQVKWATG